MELLYLLTDILSALNFFEYILKDISQGISLCNGRSWLGKCKIHRAGCCEGAQLGPTLWPHGWWPARLLCPWDFPGKNTGVGCHFLLQGIFPAQGFNPGLLHCRQTLYFLSHQKVATEGLPTLDSWTCLTEKGSPRSIHVILEIVASPCVSSCSESMVSKAGTFLAFQLSFLSLPWSRNLDWVIKVDNCYIQIIFIDYWLFLLITCYVWGLCHLWQKVLSPQVLYFSFKNPYVLPVADVSFISSWSICVWI